MTIKLTRAAFIALLGLIAVACTHDDDDDDDPGLNMAPGITSIGDRLIEANETSFIAFVIDDDRTATNALTVAAMSDNQAVIADSGLAITGSDRNRRLEITPVATQLGVANITVTVTDADGETDQTMFTLTVIEQEVLASNFVPAVFGDAANATPRDINSRVLVNDAEDTDLFSVVAP